MSLWDNGKRRWAALALALTLILLAACAAAPREEPPELLEPRGVTLDVAEVVRGTIWRTETHEGLVLPRVRDLSFAASGVMTDVNVCPGSHVRAGDILASLDMGYAVSALESQRSNLSYREENEAITEREQEIQIELKRLELENLRASGADETALRLAELRIEEMENELKETRALWALDHEDALRGIRELEALLERRYLTAPCDGTVVSCAAYDGGYALENSPLIWLAEDEELYLSVSPVTAAALERADEVYAVIDGLPSEVERLEGPETEGCREGMSSFRVLDAGERPLESGMAAVLFVISDRTEDALIVPSSAVHRDDSYFVYQIVDGVQVRRNVRCGVTNDAEVQILSGLEEGDRVYAGT